MLKINNIKVSNFYSIGSIELPIHNGLFNVLGINNDIATEDNSSNGSGKTSFFSGVYQGLFNKNTKNKSALIANVNNTVTNIPYRIDIDLSVGNKEYKIINDRNNNKITIFKDGKDISTNKIDTQLSLIKEIIGVDFDTFSSLTYLSQSNLNSIIDLTNKDNILYQFFDINAIKQTEKVLKEELKVLKGEINLTTVTINQDKKSLLLIKNFVKEDMELLHTKLANFSEQLINLDNKKENSNLNVLLQKVNNLNNRVTEYRGKVSLIEYRIKQTKESIQLFKDGICPTCKHSIDSSVVFDGENTKKELEEQKLNIIASIEKCNSDIVKFNNTIKLLNDEYNSNKTTIVDNINKIKARISYAKEQEAQFTYLEKEKALIEENIVNNSSLLIELDNKVKVIEAALALIKNGTLVNEYLMKFKQVFDVIIKDVTQRTGFNFKVITKLSKGKLDYYFYDNGKERTYNDLSAGEKTRVSLVVLISTLFALERVANIEINYLVIDELLGVLDEEGINLVKDILLMLKEKKAIFLITHHSEIESSFCDAEIIFEKNGGITKLIKGIS